MPWIYDGGNDKREAQLKNTNTYNSEGIGKMGLRVYETGAIWRFKMFALIVWVSMSEIAELL